MKTQSLRATARLLGISHVRLIQLRDTGKATPEADGRFDPAKVAAELKRTLDPMNDSKILGTILPMNGKPATIPIRRTEPRLPVSQFDARTKLTLVRAEREAFALKKDREEVLPVQEVREAWGGMLTACRSGLLSIGDELAEKLAAETDPIECRALVDGAVERELTKLAEYPANAA